MSRILIRNRLDPDNISDAHVVWEQMTTAGTAFTWRAQTRLHWCPVSSRVYAYIGHFDGSGIYSTTVFFIGISGTTATFTRLGGTPGDAGPCYSNGTGPVSQSGGWNNGDGSDMQPWPADRHPEDQSTIVSREGSTYLLQWSGLACGNPSVGQGEVWDDLWKLTLNANPTDNEWSKLEPATLALIHSGGAMAYHSGHDLIVLHGVRGVASGFPCTWEYRFTDDNWHETYNPGTVTPPLPDNGNMEYLDADHVIWFPMVHATAPWLNAAYKYNIPGATWSSNLITAGAPSNLGADQSPETLWTRITSGPWSGKFFYHRTCHTGTPNNQAKDFMFDPTTGVMTELGSTGTGPETHTDLVYMPTGSKGEIFAAEWGLGGGDATLWKGTLS